MTMTSSTASDHVTDTLASFRWLRAPDRINFKLAFFAYFSLLSSELSLVGLALDVVD